MECKRSGVGRAWILIHVTITSTDSTNCNPSKSICGQVYLLKVQTANRREGCPYVHSARQVNCNLLTKRKDDSPIVKTRYRGFVLFASTFRLILVSPKYCSGLSYLSSFAHHKMVTMAGARGLTAKQSSWLSTTSWRTFCMLWVILGVQNHQLFGIRADSPLLKSKPTLRGSDRNLISPTALVFNKI